MSQTACANSYLAAVITLYLELPETPLRASLADQALARRLDKNGVPLKIVESALLLGSLRRLIRPKEAPPLSPIRSLAYFLPVIDELTENPSPENYLDYLRLKLQQTMKTRPPAGHFSTLPDGR
jgi:hypothetical protein